MVSLGDTVSTYFNRHGGGVGVVLCKLIWTQERKLEFFIFLRGGRGVLCKLRFELREES